MSGFRCAVGVAVAATAMTAPTPHDAAAAIRARSKGVAPRAALVQTAVRPPDARMPSLILYAGLALALALPLLWWIHRGRRRDRSLVRLLDLADEMEALLDRSQDRMLALQAVVGRVPADIAAVAQASLEGWRYAFAHPDETLEVILRIMREAKIPASQAHQRWMLERMRDLIMPADSAEAMGHLQPAGFQAASTILHHHGVIKDIPDYGIFTGGVDARP